MPARSPLPFIEFRRLTCKYHQHSAKYQIFLQLVLSPPNPSQLLSSDPHSPVTTQIVSWLMKSLALVSLTSFAPRWEAHTGVTFHMIFQAHSSSSPPTEGARLLDRLSKCLLPPIPKGSSVNSVNTDLAPPLPSFLFIHDRVAGLYPFETVCDLKRT